MQAQTDAAFIEYRQVTEDYFRVMRIIPRSPTALQLRPIGTTIRLTVETDPPSMKRSKPSTASESPSPRSPHSHRRHRAAGHPPGAQ